jgi:hypothetical protein
MLPVQVAKALVGENVVGELLFMINDATAV